jgi:hypothetical protein
MKKEEWRRKNFARDKSETVDVENEIDATGVNQVIVYMKGCTMADDEKEIQRLENEFPAISGQAFAAAREKVLASGESVLQSENGFIFRFSGSPKRISQTNRSAYPRDTRHKARSFIKARFAP